MVDGIAEVQIQAQGPQAQPQGNSVSNPKRTATNGSPRTPVRAKGQRAPSEWEGWSVGLVELDF